MKSSFSLIISHLLTISVELIIYNLEVRLIKFKVVFWLLDIRDEFIVFMFVFDIRGMETFEC